MRLALVCGAFATVALVWLTAAPARPAAPPIRFAAPAQLPGATEGQPYRYSFCQPPAGGAGRCGKPAGSTNPSGGYGHYYVFSLHRSVLPSGLGLSTRSGLLSGAPAKSGSFHFTVCVADAERRAGVAPAPTCRGVGLQVNAPPTPAASFGGNWTSGTFQTTQVGANSCGSEAHGTVTFALVQNGTAVSGSMTYSVTGFTPKADASDNCDALAPGGEIPVNNATVDGTRLTGSGFTLSQTTPGAMSGTFTGNVQGFQLTATINARR